MSWLANLLEKFIDRIVPPFDADEANRWLIDWETEHEVFGPDDLWAAHYLTDAPDPPSGAVSVSPPAATPASAGGGGLSTRDEQRIKALVADYEEFLRDLFRE